MIDGKFVIIGAIVQLWGNLTYAKHTLEGKTKPNRITWFFWATPTVIAFILQLSQHVGWVSLMTLAGAIGSSVVFLVSFLSKKAYWKLGNFDYICGALALIGLIFWLIYRNADMAILISASIVALACAPTFIKAYKHPRTESVESYFGALLNSGIALLVIKHWRVAAYAFPLYIFVLNVLFVFIIATKIGERRTNLANTN